MKGFIELRQDIMQLDEASERAIFIQHPLDKTKADEYLGVWNDTKNKLSCIASNKYKIITHRNAFMEYLDCLNELGMKYEGKIINHGDIVKMEILFDKVVEDGSKGVRLGFQVSNSYNMHCSFSSGLFAYRLICTNGMYLGKAIKGASFNRHHIGDINTRELIKKFIQKVSTYEERLKALISESMKDTVEWALAKKILAKAIGIKKHRKFVEKLLEEFEGRKLTRWDIYNAITDYATHGESLSVYAVEYLQNQAQKIINKAESDKIIIEVMEVDVE